MGTLVTQLHSTYSRATITSIRGSKVNLRTKHNLTLQHTGNKF